MDGINSQLCNGAAFILRTKETWRELQENWDKQLNGNDNPHNQPDILSIEI